MIGMYPSEYDLKRNAAMNRMSKSYIPIDTWTMPGTCVCGNPVVLRKRPFRWVMPDTDRACDHRV